MKTVKRILASAVILGLISSVGFVASAGSKSVKVGGIPCGYGCSLRSLHAYTSASGSYGTCAVQATADFVDDYGKVKTVSGSSSCEPEALPNTGVTISPISGYYQYEIIATHDIYLNEGSGTFADAETV